MTESATEIFCQFPKKSFLDHLYSASTVVIAVANLFLVLYIFFKNNEKDKNLNEKNRRINLLKTLILDYNMKKFYDFFDNVILKTTQLNENNIDITKKREINDEINDLASNFRQSFIDLFLAIDKVLYEKILAQTDSLIDGLTNCIFDEGVNLQHKPKFEELITKEIRQSKTEIIKIMFLYSGETCDK